LISVVIGRATGDTLHLENWVMSCRVFKRGVELLEMERILAFCEVRSLRAIVGRYVATTSNKLVSRHFEGLGFVPEPAGPESSWRFELGVHQANCEHAIAT
jgi:predicted enzyme involved in methoxymalonyl-ACP biosynthesis